VKLFPAGNVAPWLCHTDIQIELYGVNMRLITIAILSVLALLTSPVLAQGKGKAKAAEREAGQMTESAETRMEQAREEMRGKRPDGDKAKDRYKDSDSDDDSSDSRSRDDDSSDDSSDDFSDDRSRDDDLSDDDSNNRSGNRSGGSDKANRGNATSQEMRDRRDERKAIMEASRADLEPGEEADPADESGKKPKKSWWKF